MKQTDLIIKIINLLNCHFTLEIYLCNYVLRLLERFVNVSLLEWQLQLRSSSHALTRLVFKFGSIKLKCIYLFIKILARRTQSSLLLKLGSNKTLIDGISSTGNLFKEIQCSGAEELNIENVRLAMRVYTGR